MIGVKPDQLVVLNTRI